MPSIPDELIKNSTLTQKPEVHKAIMILVKKSQNLIFMRGICEYIKSYMNENLYSREYNLKNELYYKNLPSFIQKTDSMRLFEIENKEKELNILDTYATMCFILMSKNYVLFKAKIINEYGIISMHNYRLVRRFFKDDFSDSLNITQSSNFYIPFPLFITQTRDNTVSTIAQIDISSQYYDLMYKFWDERKDGMAY